MYRGDLLIEVAAGSKPLYRFALRKTESTARAGPLLDAQVLTYQEISIGWCLTVFDGLNTVRPSRSECIQS